MTSALLVIHYDTSLFDAGSSDVAIGELISGLTNDQSWALASNVDDSAGSITLLLYSAVPLAGGTGTLAAVTFHAADNASPGMSLVDLTSDASFLNDGRLTLTALDGHIRIEGGAATIAGRHIFYNRSAWDGNNATANAYDDAAIATDKQALRAGQKATFANYTSYSHGINGLMIDVQNLGGTPTASDFVFRMGNTTTPYGNDPANPDDHWPTGPHPRRSPCVPVRASVAPIA